MKVTPEDRKRLQDILMETDPKERADLYDKLSKVFYKQGSPDAGIILSVLASVERTEKPLFPSQPQY